MKTLPLALAALLAITAPAVSAELADRETIARAARDLAAIVRDKGAPGGNRHISDCYARDVVPARQFDSAAATCLIQDFLHAQVTAAVFQRMPAEQRQATGTPEPEAIMEAMKQRLIRAFGLMNVAQEDAKQFVAAATEHGFPAYQKAYFGQ